MPNVVEILVRKDEIDEVREMTSDERRCWILLEVADAEEDGRHIHGNGAQWTWVDGDWFYVADTATFDSVRVTRELATDEQKQSGHFSTDDGEGLRRFVRDEAMRHNLANVLEALGEPAPVG